MKADDADSQRQQGEAVMSGYRHIMLAVDFDPSQESLLEKAKDLATRYQARLTLVHIIEYMGSAYAGDMPLPEDLDLDKMMRERATEELEEIAAGLGLEGVDVRVELGVAKHQITQLAKQLDVDLILVGSHGRHGLQLLLGSTANGVLHLADCDVLAVRMRHTAG
jgi:universal stress protein A